MLLEESSVDRPEGNIIRPQFRNELVNQHRPVVVIWTAFMIAIFLYLLIAQLILGNPKFSGAYSFSETARKILWLLTFVDVGYFVWWKKRFLTREAILGEARKFKLLQALGGHKTPLEEHAAKIVSSYITGKIVGFALIEAVAVYGLVLALIGRYLWDQYLLSAASAALLLRELPSKAFLEELIRDVEGERG